MSSCKHLKSVLSIEIQAKNMTFWAYNNRKIVIQAKVQILHERNLYMCMLLCLMVSPTNDHGDT